MKEFNELEKYLSGIASDSSKKIEECKTNIQNADAAIEKANTSLTEAKEKVDYAAYSKAQENIRAANYAKELYSSQIDKLINAPLISEEEYKSLIMDIAQAANMAHDELNNEASKLVDKVKLLSDQSEAVNERTNNLLGLLQYGVYKDADKRVLANGNTMSFKKEYVNEQTVSNLYQTNIKVSFLGDGKRNDGRIKEQFV